MLISREKFKFRHEKIRLLWMHILSKGKDYYKIRAKVGKFSDRNNFDVAQKGLMRFPTMKYFRISSGFNLRCINPVSGRIAPHQVVDFAMQIGTPILSISDGEY